MDFAHTNMDSKVCHHCTNGLRLENNCNRSEYYSAYYKNIQPQLKYYILPCDRCWHGKFIKDFYNFPETEILGYRQDCYRNIMVTTIDGSEMSPTEMLYNWIKYKSLTKPNNPSKKYDPLQRQH
jgi:hypothetical protein